MIFLVEIARLLGVVKLFVYCRGWENNDDLQNDFEVLQGMEIESFADCLRVKDYFFAFVHNICMHHV